MPVTYTNRKGKTYVLCQGTTKTGKLRYYFARESKGEPIDATPEGYEIRENVNGLVSLAKARPQKILPEEVAAVEAALKRHPRPHNYRLDVKHNQIVIYERVGLDVEDLLSGMGSLGQLFSHRAGELQESLDRHAQFSPVLRFTLHDEENRSFHAERWCYRGSIDDWIYVSSSSSVKEMARKLIPTLGSDAFFELY
jgi:hypothetical protein